MATFALTPTLKSMNKISSEKMADLIENNSQFREEIEEDALSSTESLLVSNKDDDGEKVEVVEQAEVQEEVLSH